MLKLSSSLSNASTLRLMSDLKHLNDDPLEGASASPASDDNIHLWQATLFGPEETPWEGGIFNLTMSFGADYPERPPKVRFTTELFHPNVYGDGSLCLDILQDKWNPIYSVSSILSLLADPNPSSPANPIAADIYKNDKKEYNKRVRKCVEYSQGL